MTTYEKEHYLSAVHSLYPNETGYTGPMGLGERYVEPTPAVAMEVHPADLIDPVEHCRVFDFDQTSLTIWPMSTQHPEGSIAEFAQKEAIRRCRRLALAMEDEPLGMNKNKE
jgi:hypothetical protein